MTEDAETAEFFAPFRRNVTDEEAGLAFIALRLHQQRGKPLATKYVDILLALAVERVAPLERSKEAAP